MIRRIFRAGAFSLALASAIPASAAPDAPVPGPQRWWRAFADPALENVMARIERDNTILADAVARLALARGSARLGQAGSMPQLALASSANYAAGPLINAAGGSGGLFTGTLTASWEPDLLGRLAPARRADKAEIRAAEADVAAARLLVETNAARAWYATTALAQARAFAAEALDIARGVEAMTGRCLANGSCTAAQLAESARERSDAADHLSLVERRDAEARDALAYLLGSRAVVADAPAELPHLPAVPAGLDAGVVAHRPDIAAAEARLEAATERQAAARRDWLPHFGLTAAGGSASATLAG